MWIEQKYISLLSNRLLKFKKKSQNLYNFRCPICGDSKHQNKGGRAVFFQRKGEFWFSCLNCNAVLSFSRFLKQFDKGLYEQYRLDLYKKKDEFSWEEKTTVTPAKKLDNSALDQLEVLSSLHESHIAKAYVLHRRIPDPWLDDLYFCRRFKSWTNSQVPGKFESLDQEESRIVIPFRDLSGTMYGYQGRIIGNASPLRYISIILDESKPKIWGWNRVDFARPFYVFEGPFDAMFIENSIATAGGKIVSELLKIGLSSLENSITVYDNEPRNPQVVKAVGKAVRNNYKVVIWPENLAEKDVNEMILAGIDVNGLLKERTFQGLEAELEFNVWKKVGE